MNPSTLVSRLTLRAAPCRWMAAAASGMALLALTGQLLPAIGLTLLAHACIDAVFASGLGLLHRQTGRISFGHAAYFGLAAYSAGLLMNSRAVPAEVAILAALVLPTVLGFGMGLLIARIQGVAHAMLTLATGQALYEVAFKWRSVTNGDDGLAIKVPASLFGVAAETLQLPGVMFCLAAGVLAVVLLGVTALARSPFGALTEAIRENPERAKFLGYGVALPCAIVYAASGAIAACAGVLFVLFNAFVTPAALHWSTSGACLVMAIVGGTRVIWGPALGALLLFFLKDVAGDMTTLWPAIVGTVLVAITLALPEGIASAVQRALRSLQATLGRAKA